MNECASIVAAFSRITFRAYLSVMAVNQSEKQVRTSCELYSGCNHDALLRVKSIAELFSWCNYIVFFFKLALCEVVIYTLAKCIMIKGLKSHAVEHRAYSKFC